MNGFYLEFIKNYKLSIQHETKEIEQNIDTSEIKKKYEHLKYANKCY